MEGNGACGHWRLWKGKQEKRENLRKIPLEKLAGADFEVTYIISK